MSVHRLLFVSLLLSSSLPILASDGDAEPMKVTLDALELADGLTMVRTDSPIGNPSTTVAVGEGGVLLVDPNLAIAEDVLTGYLDELGAGPVRYVITTHYHGDHSEGLEVFPEAVALAPRLQRDRLRTGAVVLGERPIEAEALPDLVFDDDLTLRFGEHTIDLLLPPDRSGHTDGDVLVYFREAGVLVAGDYVFDGKFPLIDYDAGGSLTGYLANLHWMLQRFPPQTRIVPGHGSFAPAPPRALSMGDLRAWLEALERTIDWVRDQLEAGRTVAQILESELPEEIERMGARPRYVKPENWIKSVHRGLSR